MDRIKSILEYWDGGVIEAKDGSLYPEEPVINPNRLIKLPEVVITAEAPTYIKYKQAWEKENPFDIDKYVEDRFNNPVGREAISRINERAWRENLRQEGLKKRQTELDEATKMGLLYQRFNPQKRDDMSIADEQFQKKYGTSPHRYRYDNDPEYKKYYEQQARNATSKIDYPSTDLRRKDVVAPNNMWMYPNLTGESKKTMTDFSNEVIGMALPIPGLEAMGKIPSVFKAGKKLIKPVSKTVGKTDDAIKAGSKVLNKTDDVGKNLPKFKSEIDWGKWNEEIPNNSKLMKEYHALEKASKADGTWMKNETLFKNEIANAQKEYDLLAKKHKELYDASQWKSKSYYPEQLRNAEELEKLNPIIGDAEDKLNFYKHLTFTPEQFIQIQSKNFKKAFPDGFDRIYRGVQKFDADNIAKGSYREVDNGNILFGTNKLSHARGYAKNGASGRNLNHYFDAINQPGFLGPNSKIAKEAVEITSDELLNPGVLDLVYDKNIQKQVIDAKGARWNELTGYGSTDDIAAKMKSGEIKEPIVQINNIHDGGDYFGNYKESMNTMIDPTKVRLKSLRHNNGMFDMTNPNIYKGIIPPALLFYLQSQQQNKTEQ